MILDKQLMWSDSQVVSANGNSTDQIDLRAATSLYGENRMFPFLTIVAKSGTGPSLQVKLVGADDSGFSTNAITVFDTGVKADPALGDFPIGGSPASRRFWRLEYTVGGTTPSFTIVAGLVADKQSKPL